MSDAFIHLATASRHWSGDSPTGAMLGSTRAFLAAASKDDSLIEEAAASLPAQDPGSAAWICVTLGTLVERGSSPEACGPAVLDHLQSCLHLLPASAGDDEPSPDPTRAQTTLLAQFRYVCQSAVTHLARLTALRESLGQDVALLERLSDLGAWSHGALWVREALLKTSGTLILLHPPGSTGLRLWYSNVANNFHLFSLLQTAVGTRIPGGRVADDTIALVARGKSADSISDQAWWHYGHPGSPKADLQSSIWGEGLVREIPRVNGEQIMLLWPPILASRLWDAGFLRPHLEAMPADAGVERMLTPEEAAEWLEKLGLGQSGLSQKRKWWHLSR